MTAPYEKVLAHTRIADSTKTRSNVLVHVRIAESAQRRKPRNVTRPFPNFVGGVWGRKRTGFRNLRTRMRLRNMELQRFSWFLQLRSRRAMCACVNLKVTLKVNYGLLRALATNCLRRRLTMADGVAKSPWLLIL